VIGSETSSNTRALERTAWASGCQRVLRVDNPSELPDDLTGTVGVIAGASAPEEVVQELIAHLAPRAGVEEVRAIEEDEYFPLPRELRETVRQLSAAAAVAGLAPGGDPTAGGDQLPDDRELSAAVALAGLTH
jgi:4-hydroxy-3-methylbut-2-enyl diphosphate reductase